jgi:hypothetical protein
VTGPAGLDPVVTVPFDLDTEDRLLGPVTFRMAGWLAAAGAGAAAVAFSGGAVLLIATGVLLLPLGLAGAFLRPAGRPLLAWARPLLGYRRRERARRETRS